MERSDLTAGDAIGFREDALKRAVAMFGRGSSQARQAAIDLCLFAGYDPHFRYAIQRPVDLSGHMPMNPPSPEAPLFVEEWQRVLDEIVPENRVR
jgi:hypothetical protein